MTLATVAAAPGRPGNLTPEQTEKLKEMWAQTLDLLGVAASGMTTPSSKRSESPDAKKKKSKLSMFRRRDSSQTDVSDSMADNDKHGQVKAYQKALAEMTPEQLREAFWSFTKHDHPDAILLRFLRARKWNVEAAMVMMISAGHWRAREAHVDDDIMRHGEGQAAQDTESTNRFVKTEGEGFMLQLRLGKSFFHSADRENRPCCFVRVRLHHGGDQSVSSLERYTVHVIESGRLLLRPPVDTATIVFDMTDFSMANMDYTPVVFMIKCFEANYPESLGSVIIYKSPWLFQGIWRIIKGWLDPVVANKVHFANNINDLDQWIPRSRVMKELGGDEDFTYSYIEPAADENKTMEDTATRDALLTERAEIVKAFESDTLAWIQGQDPGDGRTELANRLIDNYWRVDPYIRARSIYDRAGFLGPQGKLDLFPHVTARTKAANGDVPHGDAPNGVVANGDPPNEKVPNGDVPNGEVKV